MCTNCTSRHLSYLSHYFYFCFKGGPGDSTQDLTQALCHLSHAPILLLFCFLSLFSGRVSCLPRSASDIGPFTFAFQVAGNIGVNYCVLLLTLTLYFSKFCKFSTVIMFSFNIREKVEMFYLLEKLYNISWIIVLVHSASLYSLSFLS
jgi:hypothetical protein